MFFCQKFKSNFMTNMKSQRSTRSSGKSLANCMLLPISPLNHLISYRWLFENYLLTWAEVYIVGIKSL